MPAKGILTQLKDVVRDMVDKNGEFRVTEVGELGHRKLSENRIRMLRDILYLIKNTDIVTDITRVYIFNPYMSIADVYKEYEAIGAEIPAGTVKSKIQWDSNRLNKALGGNIITDLIYTNKDVEVYESNILEAFGEYGRGKRDLRGRLAINLKEGVYNSNITDDDFEEFIGTIAPYSKTQMEYVGNNIPLEQIAYFNYLQAQPRLSELDLKRLDRIKMVLGMTEDGKN